MDAERGRALLVRKQSVVRRRRFVAFRTDRRVHLVEAVRLECRRFELAEVATDRVGVAVIRGLGADRHLTVSLI